MRLIQGREVIWFVDNKVARATLIRRASSQEDVTAVAEVVFILSLKLDCRVRFEWIDSKSNPLDGLSRDGLACPEWGLWAKEARQPPWSSPRRTSHEVFIFFGPQHAYTLGIHIFYSPAPTKADQV